MMNQKRGELATSTLIILIATILVITGILFAIFSNLDFLSSTSYKNLKLTDNYISKGIDVVTIDASDGRNDYFDSYFATIQVLPDSEQVDFRRMELSIHTSRTSAALTYRNGTPTQGPGGYETFAVDSLGEALVADYDYQVIQINPGSFRNLNYDIDGDGDTNDYVATCDSIGTFCAAAYNDVALIFNLSTAGIQYAWLNDTSGSLVDISPSGPVALDISYAAIGDLPYGFITTVDTKADFTQHTMTPTGPFFIYAEPIVLQNDLDLDGFTDYVVTNDTHLRIFPSSEKLSIDVALGGDISAGAVVLNVNQDLYLSNGTYIGNLELSGTASNGQLPDSTVRITPNNEGTGYYQVEYLITSPMHLTDRLTRGEVAKIYVDSPHRMGPNQDIRFNFIVSEGVSFPVTAFTGHTIRAAQFISLYPKI